MTRGIAIALAVMVIGVVLELVRREKLTFKYAFGWLTAGVVALFFAVFDHCLFQLAYVLGFQLPSNFIFFALLTILVFLSLLMTLFLCQQNARNDALAQKLALLELELDQLKKKRGENG